MTGQESGPDAGPGIAELAARVHDRARAAQRDDVVAMLEAAAGRWRDPVTTVVLAGAQKRGKSMLVNTLVGHPGLLPVDADVATDAEVVLRYGPEVTAVVHGRGADGPTATPVDPDLLADYASVLGDPRTREGVTGVELTVPSPLLDGVRLVDTPGVDGLTAGHRHATLAAIASADVLLFAVSAQDQPLLGEELDFLRTAAERLHDVAFVLTKIDDSVGWRDLLAENRERLARFVETRRAAGEMDEPTASRLLAAPWLPVSARLADAARDLEAAGRAERAADRLARSGLPDVHALFDRLAADREAVRTSGLVAAVGHALRVLDEELEDREIGGSGDDDEVRKRERLLRAEDTRFREMQNRRRRGGAALGLLGQQTGRRVTELVAEHRRSYETEIAALTTPQAVADYTATVSDSLERTVEAVAREAAGEAERMARTALRDYLAEFGVEEHEIDAGSLREHRVPVAPLRPSADGPGFDIVGEGLPAGMMATTLGFMTHNLIGSVAGAAGGTGAGAATAVGAGSVLAATAAVAVPVVVGLGLAGLLLRHRRRVAVTARSRKELTRSVADVLSGASSDITLAVQEAVAVWRADADVVVDEQLAAGRRTLDRRRARLEQARRAGEQDRARRAAEATTLRARVAEDRAQLAALTRGAG